MVRCRHAMFLTKVITCLMPRTVLLRPICLAAKRRNCAGGCWVRKTGDDPAPVGYGGGSKICQPEKPISGNISTKCCRRHAPSPAPDGETGCRVDSRTDLLKPSSTASGIRSMPEPLTASPPMVWRQRPQTRLMAWSMLPEKQRKQWRALPDR